LGDIIALIGLETICDEKPADVSRGVWTMGTALFADRERVEWT
jgi:hypothetical protein